MDHFYPFGLRMAGISTAPAVPNFYTFTGKEYQDELGLGWIDFGARMLDPATGRWNGVDVQAENYFPVSPYAYVANNPLIFVDPNGEQIDVSYLLFRDKEGKLNQDNVYKLFSMMLDLSEITGMELKVENKSDARK